MQVYLVFLIQKLQKQWQVTEIKSILVLFIKMVLYNAIVQLINSLSKVTMK